MFSCFHGGWHLIKAVLQLRFLQVTQGCVILTIKTNKGSCQVLGLLWSQQACSQEHAEAACLCSVW